MIQNIVQKIENQISLKPLSTYKVDTLFLYRVYSLLLQECVPHEEIEHYLVAFGLLQLHQQSHEQLLTKPSCLRANILDGDYFYSCYYEYASTHAFHLIEKDFASYLAKTELIYIDDYLSLFDTIQNFLHSEDLYYGLS